jgi:hypothetical protein
MGPDILAATNTRDWYGTWSADERRVVINDLRRPLEDNIVRTNVWDKAEAMFAVRTSGFTADGFEDASGTYGGRPVWAFTNLRKASE